MVWGHGVGGSNPPSPTNDNEAPFGPPGVARPWQVRHRAQEQAMRILLVTDTHGRLGIVNDLAERLRADAVIHAGDLGFYDDGSVHRLTDRELMLRIVHSGLPERVKQRARSLGTEDRARLVQEGELLGELPGYLSGAERFAVPVYAVWGNHEDIEVVKAFREGRYSIPNLAVLDEHQVHATGPFAIFGLGGNLLMGKKLFHKPLAGGGGRVWTTLAQYGGLLKTVAAHAPMHAIRVFVSHVSPGKEPLVRHAAAHLAADYTVSGHMGPPHCMVWNDFAIRSVEQARDWLRVHHGAVRAAWDAAKSGGKWDDAEVDAVESALRMLETLPNGTRRTGRGEKEPIWYRDNVMINLPDAENGRAVLIEEEGAISLETYGHGRSAHVTDVSY